MRFSHYAIGACLCRQGARRNPDLAIQDRINRDSRVRSIPSPRGAEKFGYTRITELYKGLITHLAQVILLDMVMPRKNGLEAINGIKKDNPEARILVLTSFDDDERVFSAIKAGALGYLLKDSSPQQLLQAIDDVHHGRSSLHPAIALKVIRELNQPTDLPPTEEPLTEREMETLRLIAQGLTNQEIADKLNISERTVGKHVSNILDKLHLANRTQVALYALRRGLATLDPE